ncbi:phosphonate C-P lyase system protein PhnH [Sulfurimonas crateris]|uniref:Phosphonate C-P lyase system protein PhnH n=1 Tax=Sulfurimonas crateris TaxID=2574727 RepID=A0A4U2Z8S0_9BACT|nr:phosphonate C-P lyase system protein PhnH [Sulfurimonas crateris]TKI69381.1 phosphonate C-P lyase system protein PhnH [Sulfurimonas crateris]
MENVDLEQLNRQNFKSLSDALAMPGKITQIKSVFDSYLLGVANVLFFNEVTYYYSGDEDITLIEAITNPKATTMQEADYILSDVIDTRLINEAKRGDYLNPDFSATLILKCEDFNNCTYFLSGPGIDGKKEVNLPCNKEFIDILMQKNSDYPLGIEIFFINSIGELIALSRTTKVEVR